MRSRLYRYPAAWLLVLVCSPLASAGGDPPSSANFTFFPVGAARNTADDRPVPAGSQILDEAQRRNSPGDDVLVPVELTGRGQASRRRQGCDSCRRAGATGCRQEQQCACNKQQELNQAVAGAHKGLFYNNDFSYLNDPAYDQWWPGDRLKRNRIGDCWVWDVGGQYRLRLHNERHHRGLGLTGRNDDFLLHRTRVYGNIQYSQWLRVYAEYIDAESNYEDFPPRSIEVNRSDLNNLFGDLRVLKTDRGGLWLRAGRQELLYGSQRLITPLDWSNTRRRFDGYKVFWKGENWDLDAFYVRPIPVDVNRFDSPDFDREFMGFFASYKGIENETLDLYYLAFNSEVTPFKYDTYGARYSGSDGPWLWDVEGAYQSGTFQGANHDAGFWVVGFGRKMEQVTWKPTVWVYYDWASGDEIQGNGFDHLFPLGHRYLGFMDLFGRRNLEDANVLITAKPRPQLTLLLWYHYFSLENGNDVPYNVNLTPFNAVNPPASQDLGHEIDLVASWNINARLNLLFGYSHFFAGGYYRNTPGLPFRGDADFYYTQMTFNF